MPLCGNIFVNSDSGVSAPRRVAADHITNGAAGDRPVRPPVPPAAAGARPGGRAWPGHQGLALYAGFARRGGYPGAGGARLRAQFPQSGGLGGRLRQERPGAGRAAPPRLRLRRGRHRDAAGAGRQSAPAPVPAGGRRGRDQPARLQQRGRAGGAGAAGRPRPRGRCCGRECRRQPRFGRPRRGLCAADRDFRAGRELFHRQRLVAQHAGPARPAAGGRARRSAGPRGGGARGGAPALGADAGAAQDRARS